MSLKSHSHEDIKTMSMLELANLVLLDKKKNVPFNELFDEIAGLKEFTDEQKTTYLPQLYTDINIDGRFVNVGSNTWGLKRWYPVDEVIKDTKPTPKKKTKKKPVKKKATPKKEEENEEEVDAPDTDMEELTADFSKLDGEDDVDEDEENFDIFSENLDLDDEIDDEEDEEDEELPKENK